MKEQMREAFEAWAEKELLPLDKRDSEHYRYNLTNRAWAGWKAALSAVPANHVGDSNEMGQSQANRIAELEETNGLLQTQVHCLEMVAASKNGE